MYIAQVIALDENDQIVGHVNKYLSHRFVPGTPRGILHRAFSVFLFDQDGKLLLQKVWSLRRELGLHQQSSWTIYAHATLK